MLGHGRANVKVLGEVELKKLARYLLRYPNTEIYYEHQVSQKELIVCCGLRLGRLSVHAEKHERGGNVYGDTLH